MGESLQVDPKMFRSPKRESTVDMVIEKIRELLLSRRLKPGDRLPTEMELAKHLAASRGSVREAMKILESFGVVDIRRGDGTYVSQSMSRNLFDHLLFQLIASDTDKRKLIELRELIETGIIRIVIANASDADLDHLRDVHSRMEAMRARGETDARVFAQCDIDFHHALGEATHNELIEKIYRFTMELFADSIARTHEASADAGEYALDIHRTILDSIAERDLELAQRAIQRSLETWIRLSA